MEFQKKSKKVPFNKKPRTQTKFSPLYDESLERGRHEKIILRKLIGGEVKKCSTNQSNAGKKT